MSAEEPRTPLPGVPHNLGVTGAINPPAPSGTGGSPAQSDTDAAPGPHGTSPAHQGEPYRAPHPGGVQSGQYGERVEGGADQATKEPASQDAAPAPEPQSATPETGKRSRPADRIITLILLGVGALGALYSASTLYQLPNTLVLIAGLLGAEDVTVPEAVNTLSTIGALTILTLYALTLIFSLRRLSARKLTFWAPLTAGILAVIISTVFTFSAMMITPEIMQLASDPDAVDKLLAGLTELQANTAG